MIQNGLALAVIAAAIILTARKVDVRLALGLGAVALFVIAGKLPAFFGVFAREMANPATVVPICSALGFCYVLRETGCDTHLIRLLLAPLRYVRPLLIPGGVAAGYLVNTTLVSQVSSAAVLGPILIPLLRAGGIPAATAGAAVLLGCSMGGELFNPGAVEVATLAGLTGRGTSEVIRHIMPWNLLASSIGLTAFWFLTRRRREAPVDVEGPSKPELERVNLIKAAVPVLPLLLRFLVPDLIVLPKGEFPKLDEPVSILTVMLIGCAVAAATAPRKASRLASAFFEGAGYGYIHVISLIVTAAAFAQGIQESGLIQTLIERLSGAPAAAIAAAILLPWALARICGSGIAPAVAVMRALVPSAERLGLDALQLGAITAVSAHFGRTMSPAAAVVAVCATLAGRDRSDLLRLVTIPLLCGLAVLLGAAWLQAGFGE